MNTRLVAVLKNNKVPLKDGDFINAYNGWIGRNGISGTITTRVNDSNMLFVAVSNEREKILHRKR